MDAAGDGSGSGSGQQQRIRGNPHAAEVKPVSIEADGEGGVGLGHAAVVDAAGGDEELHARVVELEVAGLAEVDGELRAGMSEMDIYNRTRDVFLYFKLPYDAPPPEE
jgi:hypothetical protein